MDGPRCLSTHLPGDAGLSPLLAVVNPAAVNTWAHAFAGSVGFAPKSPQRCCPTASPSHDGATQMLTLETQEPIFVL